MRGTASRTAAALLMSAALFGLAFSYRTDYLGHYLGGFGGTLLLLSVVPVMPPRWRDRAVVAGVLIAIGLGFGTESTIFELAIFDPVDFYNQSLGAVVAGCCVVGDRSRAATSGLLVILSLGALFAGFYFAFL